ncbi:hypothetical protein GQ457_11G030180 [Hibiscus cannabinus]
MRTMTEESTQKNQKKKRNKDALPTFPDRGAFSCIGKELGMPIESVFSSISASPIAAAGLGRVYKAQLKYSGQTVTVKVQRPVVALIDEFARRGVEFTKISTMSRLVSLPYHMAYTCLCAMRMLILAGCLQEGQNAKKFKTIYADKEDIFVPVHKVLMMEWINGVKLNQQAAIESQGLKVIDSNQRHPM